MNRHLSEANTIIKLYKHQLEAVDNLHIGSILNGEVGTGKTLTGLSFYKRYYSHLTLIVITTAKKRNEGDWEVEAGLLDINRLTVDSWQNIESYKGLTNAFFIFDEQRAVGNGKWAKTFVAIAKKNKWIMLTGTPGDKWEDYIPVFLANGFYRNKTEFINLHLEYSRFTKFPLIIKYHNIELLECNRAAILVEMKMERHTTRHRHNIFVGHDEEMVKRLNKERWNIYKERPMRNVSEFMSVLRRLVNTHESRIFAAKFLIDIHDKLIVFYNYRYELDILREICTDLRKDWYEYNGLKHEYIPDEGDWIYLVQYTAGAEGWNCITTNTILFYSQNYSYKIKEQSEGRVDRLNTPYYDLDYYYLISDSKLDKDIARTLEVKKKFNTGKWLKKEGVVF